MRVAQPIPRPRQRDSSGLLSPPQRSYGTEFVTQKGLAPPGLITRGNIDIRRRPVARSPITRNEEGALVGGIPSTVRSMSFEADGREVLVPTVSDDGRLIGNEEAKLNYYRTGRHLGIFDTPQNATSYSKWLHDAYEKGWIQLLPMQLPSGIIDKRIYDNILQRDA